MPYLKAAKLINTASREKEKDKLLVLYASAYPHMTKDTYMTFEEFVEKSMPTETEKVYDMRSKDEIMKEIAEIEKKNTRK